MKYARTTLVAFLVAMGTVLSVIPTARADDSAHELPPIYVGVNIGQSKTKSNDAAIDLNSGLAANGFTVTSNTTKDTDTAYRLFVGYQVSDYFALEAGYVNFGKFNLSANTLPAGSAGADIKASGWTFDALGILPVGNNFSLLGQLGATRSEVRENISSSGAVVFIPGTALNLTATKTSYDFGFGVEYHIPVPGFNKMVGIRGEWQRYAKLGDKNTTGEGDIDLLSIGAVFRF